MAEIPAEALAAGFEVASSGVHDSKTMMLRELGRLLEACPADACPADACPDEYRAAAIENSVLLKQSVEGRKSTLPISASATCSALRRPAHDQHRCAVRRLPELRAAALAGAPLRRREAVDGRL